MTGNQWFGRSWGAPICEAENYAETPVGEPCLRCREVILPGDSGMITLFMRADGSSLQPQHLACFMRGIVGGLNHLRGCCTCCGGTEEPDPPGMTTREAAEAALQYWQANAGR